MKREFRVRAAEIRAAEGDKPAIEGYAAVFDQVTELFCCPGYAVREVIKPGAFKRSLGEGADVRCFFNHDEDMVLGRTKSGTLQLREDSKGLFFHCDLPDTQIGRDVREMVRRGDVDGCSFSFIPMEQNRSEQVDSKTGDVTITRELMDCDIDDCDVGPVTFPAYEQTSVEARSRQMFPGGVPDELKPPTPGADSAAIAAADEERARMQMQVEVAKVL